MRILVIIIVWSLYNTCHTKMSHVDPIPVNLHSHSDTDTENDNPSSPHSYRGSSFQDEIKIIIDNIINGNPADISVNANANAKMSTNTNSEYKIDDSNNKHLNTPTNSSTSTSTTFIETKLCTTCHIDKNKSGISMHCGKCNMCVVGLDHHCPFVNNCVGRGNRRIFTIFCFTASLGCILSSIACLYNNTCSLPSLD